MRFNEKNRKNISLISKQSRQDQILDSFSSLDGTDISAQAQLPTRLSRRDVLSQLDVRELRRQL